MVRWYWYPNKDTCPRSKRSFRPISVMNPSCSSLKLYARFFALHTSCQFSLYLLGASRSIARIRYLSNFVLRQICQILSYRISFVPIRIIDNWQRYDSCSILLFPPILLFHPIQRLAPNFSKQKLNFLKEFSKYNIQFSLLTRALTTSYIYIYVWIAQWTVAFASIIDNKECKYTHSEY